MPEILGGLYSFGNRTKRQLRDLLSNPAAYLEQSAEKLRDDAGRSTSARRVAERALEPSEADIERSAAWWNPSPLGALAGVVKQKGGNWLAGSVEDALKGLKRSDPTVGRWIEGPLTKYFKTRMASPEDEVRRLAEQGVLHIPLGNYPRMVAEDAKQNRLLSNGQSLAKSRLGKQWENLSDQAVAQSTAGQSIRSMPWRLEQNPWLQNVDPETKIYHFNPRSISHGETLGFPHLIDELSNALDPASGLPRHLQLTPEAMQNLSMEKAVRRVHDINEWRAAQQAELNKQRATSKVAHVVREYAENNPKGLHWREIGTTDEGYLKDYFGTEDAYRKALEDQLKYEGDIMQNCVGGERYCEGVLAGRTRIFSLRDAKGEPHVTVEVGHPTSEQMLDRLKRMNPNESDGPWLAEEYERAMADDTYMAKRHPYMAEILQTKGEEATGADFLNALLENEADDELIKELKQAGIRQIKGKGNRAPNKKYLPFVQDFVRNSPLGGPWSDVGDLANTGLLANKLHPSGFITREELEAAAKNPPEGYAPEDFIWPEGYASGGRVTPITIRPGTETATTGTRGRSWDILSE